MISDSLGPIIHFDGLRFLDTPSISATLARCRYIRTSTGQQSKWRQDNPDNCRPLTVAERTALALRAEHAGTALSAPPPPMLGRTEIAASRTAASVPPRIEHRLPRDEQSAPVEPPMVTGPHTPPTRDAIIIDGRPLLRQEDAAAILGVGVRTLQRWHKKNAGPPHIKIGRTVYYDPDELTAWVRANRSAAQKPGYSA